MVYAAVVSQCFWTAEICCSSLTPVLCHVGYNGAVTRIAAGTKSVSSIWQNASIVALTQSALGQFN